MFASLVWRCSIYFRCRRWTAVESLVGILPKPAAMAVARLEPFGLVILIGLLIILPMLGAQWGQPQFHLRIRRAMMARRAQFAVVGEIDTTISLNSLAILEEVMRHFYWKARFWRGWARKAITTRSIKRGRKPEGRERWRSSGMRKSRQFAWAVIPNAPVLPENMTLDELRDSIMADLERLREMGVLDLPRLPQGVVANSNADLPTNGGSSDQAE